ncbi:MAG: hypothetical protein CMA08_03260 [Euryarchaeota archaeon]|nr:hypothetical protein [Euryarchaeota archaeon]OUX22245.1 MAG: hypothetical protein CBE12_02615 [Euryarchaeota archaeon TMED252]DAC35275.1 MAG TPA: hypothetical protein D7H96_05450 [Candidatus Poseidoniales archaeon]HIH53722.1 hypothetical protein [Candidatus Poseidoniaceae archaeon]|tara:strand:+ start:578 stop:934 length:357 start_codon:yes stop_codon:yes gene_type:complete
MSLSMRTVSRMFGLSGIVGLAVWWLDGTMMTGMLALIAACAVTAIVWAITESSPLDGAIDLRIGTLLGHLGAFLVGMVSTLWMVNSLGYPMAESALTMLATVGLGYATYLWMEPNAKV